MAERKSSMLAKSVSKHAVRAKEKFLQNLGKVDRTADDIFDEHLENFTRQQTAATRLQKEFTNYIRCIRAVQGASKTLYECIADVYEGGWTGQDLVYLQSQSLEMLWQDLSHKLADQVLLPLNTYCAQFPEMRKKIDKRSRKLVDYDSNRHNLQSLEGGGKKRDETKMSKAKEQLVQAKRTYDALNSELHDDLPALYHSRILFLVNNLQTLFSTEQVFHSETSKVFSELEAIVDKLATDSQKQSYNFSQKTNSIHKNQSINIVNNVASPGSPSTTGDSSGSAPGSPKEEGGSLDGVDVKPEEPESNGPTTEQSNEEQTNGQSNGPVTKEAELQEEAPKMNGNVPTTNGTHSPDSKPPSPDTENSKEKRVEDLYDIPPGATTENLPPGVLYRVKATYRYNREDVDELSFDVNELIRVVAYDDPDQQEDGWLMGIKESTLEKGMFPANFTRPL